MSSVLESINHRHRHSVKLCLTFFVLLLTSWTFYVILYALQVIFGLISEFPFNNLALFANLSALNSYFIFFPKYEISKIANFFSIAKK